MADLTPYQRDIVIRTALGENRGHGEDGMADVIQNIFNRANSGRFPSDPAKVALQPKQYSTWNKSEGGNNPQQFKPGTSIWNKAERALEAVLAGRPDPTGGALDYHASNISPYWASSKDRYGTITRNGHTFYPTHPVPPGEIPSVGTFLDTVRMPPTPKTQTGVGRYMRNNTSPLGGNTALPIALQRYATTQANKVSPAMRRPTLPAMGTPNVDSLYAGIFAPKAPSIPQSQIDRGGPRPSAPNLTSPGAVNATVGGLTQNAALQAALSRRLQPTIPRSQIERTALPIGQSQIDRGTSRLPIAQGNLTNPGAIEASVNAAGKVANPTLQAALSRMISAPKPVPQSLIERTQPPIGQSQIERTALPRAPSDLTSQSMQRIASANPTRLPAIALTGIGQAPSTRMVQSVPMPPVRQSIPQRQVGEEPGLPRTAVTQLPRITISTPNTVPQRLVGQDAGNVPRGLENLAKVAAGTQPPLTQGQRLEILRNNQPIDRLPVGSKGLPENFGNANIGLADVANMGVPLQNFAPIPGPPRPPQFRTEMQNVRVQNPAWSPAPPSSPPSGKLNNTIKPSTAKQEPRYITVQKPVQVPVAPRAPILSAAPQMPAPVLGRSPLQITVSGATIASPPVTGGMTVVNQLRAQGLTPASAYAEANRAAAQAAAQGGKYYNPGSYENRLGNSADSGTVRSLF